MLCFTVLLALLSIPTYAADGADLKISVLRYEPAPAEIGEYVSVWVKLENLGFARADDVSIRMVPEYPFSLDSQSNAIEDIGILSPDNAAVHEYRLFVDSGAREGLSTFEVWYQEDGSGTWFKKEFEMRVGSDTFDSRGTIQLDGTPVIDPEVFMPGDEGTITFALKNSATEYSITLDGEQYDTNARIQSASLESLDEVKVTTESYYGNGVLGPGESLDLTYNIEVGEDTPDGTYYLDLSLVGSSHVYNNNWRIPLKVDSSSVRVIPSKPLVLENGKGVLEFDVANIHPNLLSSVSVQLDAEGVEFSPIEYFIGAMDPDELFTIEFDAEAVDEDQDFPVDLVISANFRNGLNEHSQEIDTRQLRHQSLEDDGNSGIVIAFGLLMVAGVAAYVLYKRKMKRED
ncbi:COG1361 S-layer family protein [Methanolobus sp. ZRKC3]|uniref:COG1361 S-layer family protein n=1 Tax=Methanolobus sp. ZRKC3 TaxID=3125786 RepID=UPI003244FAE1